MPTGDNPFAILTAVIAPAMLTNACSVLALGTGNRVGRVVDRTRVVAAERVAADPDSAEYHGYSEQLAHLQMRGRMLIRSLRFIYAALGSFVASALSAVLGAMLDANGVIGGFEAAAVVGFIVGTIGVAALVSGCILMVRETRLAVQTTTEEIELMSRSG